MSKLVQIPESTLQTLLRKAGRTESVDAYLRSAEVQSTIQTGHSLLKRARAAYWSRFWLFFSAAVTWGYFIFEPDLEGFISGVLLTGMTVVEFKVYDFFLAADVRGSIYGWWNQCLFSVLFVIYGGYHGTFITVSPDVSGLLDPSMFPTLVSTERVFYYTVAVVGGLGQFWLACYYRTARK